MRQDPALTMRPLAAVLGWPVARSPSPAMHNAAFAALGLDWVYERIAVRPGAIGEAVHLLRALNARGANVTIPHKVAVVPYLDEVVGDAAATGSVNTIVADGSRFVGHSTDGEGFLRALGWDPAGRTATVLGAGGAARAVAYALARAGAQVRVCARGPDAAAAVAALHPAIEAAPWAAPPDGDLLVNATPLREGLPASPRAGQVVCDLIYLPPETELLARARAAGARALDGLGMLVEQAALSFTAWTGETPPVRAMENAARATFPSR